MHVNLPWCNLSPLSPSMHRSAVKPEAHIIHSTCRYFAGGGTNLVGIRLYGIQLLQQTLLDEPLPFYGFVFVFLPYIILYSSYYSSSPSFLFCSLAGFHLECTSNCLGATSLWPAGLPKAIKYQSRQSN